MGSHNQEQSEDLPIYIVVFLFVQMLLLGKTLIKRVAVINKGCHTLLHFGMQLTVTKILDLLEHILYWNTLETITFLKNWQPVSY